MQTGIVYANGTKAGILRKNDEGDFTFVYDSEYLADVLSPPVSLTLPKQLQPFTSSVLFPFFFGLLAEGNAAKEQCLALKIDENDYFTRLLKTTNSNCIGFVTVKEKQL